MDISVLKDSLWQQFGASIDMLRNAIVMWPEEKWKTRPRFFYMAYHTLFFLEYYLTTPRLNFSATLPASFIDENNIPPDAIDDISPDRIYSKMEVLDYLDLLRNKCRSVIESLSDDNILDRWVECDGPKNYLMLELLMYNMRHVQHHAAQLNTMLRNEINNAPRWVSRAVTGK